MVEAFGCDVSRVGWGRPFSPPAMYSIEESHGSLSAHPGFQMGQLGLGLAA